MSTLSLSSKISIGIASGVATVGAISGTAFGLGLGPFAAEDKVIYLVGKSLGSDVTQDTSELIVDGKNNYQCLFAGDDSSIDKDCSIESINPSSVGNDKNQLTLKSFKGIKGTDVIKSDLVSESKYFKLTISKNMYEKLNLKESPVKNIELTVKGDVSKKFASLKPLFSFKSNKSLGKAQYAIGKIKQAYSIASHVETKVESLTSLTSVSFQCSFGNDKNTKEACKIYKFTSNGDASGKLEEQTYAKDGESSQVSEIKKDHYYIFKFDNADGKEISEFSQDGLVSVTSGDKKIDVIDLTPSYILVDGENHKIFKLK